MVALSSDDEPDLDSRMLISPCFRCGPFTLHNPTCVQVSEPESSLVSPESRAGAPPSSSHFGTQPAAPTTCSVRDCAGRAAMHNASVTRTAFKDLLQCSYH